MTQGGHSGAGTVLCWHPFLDILAVATNSAVVEYDAISGCRMNMVDCDGSPVKLRYTLDGNYLILLTRVCCIAVIWSSLPFWDSDTDMSM